MLVSSPVSWQQALGQNYAYDMRPMKSSGWTALFGIIAASLSSITTGHTSPANPVLVGHTPFNAVPLSPPPFPAIDGAYDVTVSGNFAFVTSERRGSFSVFDISDPSNPTFIVESPHSDLVNARFLALDGAYLYFADPKQNAIGIFDVSDPRNPQFVSKLSNSAVLKGAHSVAVLGDYAYVGTLDADSVVAIDISDKLLPQIVGYTQGPAPGTTLNTVRKIYGVGNYVYVAPIAGSGLGIIDVSYPSRPTWKATVPCPGGGSPAVNGVMVVDNYAYIACSNSGTFAIIDVTDPEHPVVVGWTRGPEPGKTLTYASNVFVSGNFAYVPLSHFHEPGGAVVILDISDKTNPVVVGQTTEVREAQTAFVRGDFLYTASDAWDAFMVFYIGPEGPFAAPPPAPTCTLSANPFVLSTGQSTTLYWTTDRATSGTILGLQGKTFLMNPVAAGSLTDTPNITVKYSGSVADGTGGQPGTCGTVVPVSSDPPPPEPTVSLAATPEAVEIGGATTLSWSSTNATSCAASGDWSGPQPLSGSQSEENLTATRTYTLTCTGAVKWVSQTVTVSVAPPPPEPTVSLIASPEAVAYGGSTQLTWSSTDALSCLASDGWSGDQPTSGSQSLENLITTITYTLACSGAGGNVSQSVTVLVAPPPPTLVLVDKSIGSLLGDMKAAGGLAAAFDGVSIQTGAASAGRNTASAAYLGKTLPSPLVFGKMVVRGAKDGGFVLASNNSVTLTVYGKNGTPPTSATNGTVIGTITFQDTYNPPAQSIDSTHTSTAWTHIWVRMAGTAGSFRIAEVDLFELR